MILDRDVILQKINSIQNCLATIHKATQGNPEKLNDQIIQDAVVLNLQRAIQLCIDLGSYVVANLNWGLPANLREIFTILYSHQVINEIVYERMVKMVGFKNIAVHDYQRLSLVILKQIIINHLSDFENFYSAILNDCHSE